MDKSFEKLRVFISYGHDEYSPFAQGVADELRKRGHDVWFDVEELREGKDWETYIENGLNWVGENTATGRIILIMTPYSVRRPDGFCLNEIAKALDNKLQIIPVMLVWATPPLSIYRLQYLDMQNSHNKTQITEDFSLDISKIIN
ncbi:MAG: toll/interleukin-1 receptor domain-containing protein [Rikenellaceae bacterium]